MAEPEDYEIIAGIGNEVFYFFGEFPSRLTILDRHHFSSACLLVRLGRAGLVLYTSGESSS